MSDAVRNDLQKIAVDKLKSFLGDDLTLQHGRASSTVC
jgi:hypothetical protein